MRILVTGAAGFIGSNLCEMLAENGHEVFGIDNLDPYYDRATKELNLTHISQLGVRIREQDVRDVEGLKSLVDVTKPEVIIHLAAKAGVRNSLKFPRQYIETNLLGAQNVMDAALFSNVERIVLASTSSVYGDCDQTPFPESHPAISPKQPYAASKRAAEILASTYHYAYELQTTVTRFFTVYGPRGRPDMMPHMLANSIYNGTEVTVFDGDLWRDWTYITDICDGLMRAASTPLGFEVLNLGRGKPESLASFIHAMEQAANGKANLTRAPRPASEMMRTFADTTKAEKLLGFRPTVSIEEGASKYCAWYESTERGIKP